MRVSTPFIVSTLLAAVASAAVASAAMASAALALKIYVVEDGVYRVGFDELAAAGLAAKELSSADLALSSAGEPVPLWVEDGGDGLFGPGDWIEFVGAHLAGSHSYFSEYSDRNVYVLAADSTRAARMATLPAAPLSAGAPPLRLEAVVRVERDEVLIRDTPDQDDAQAESWFWSRLSLFEPFEESFDLPGLDPAAASVSLKISFRGWSVPAERPQPEMADHRVEVALNGVSIGEAEWNAEGTFELELENVSSAVLEVGNRLELRVPESASSGQGTVRPSSSSSTSRFSTGSSSGIPTVRSWRAGSAGCGPARRWKVALPRPAASVSPYLEIALSASTPTARPESSSPVERPASEWKSRASSRSPGMISSGRPRSRSIGLRVSGRRRSRATTS